MRVVRRLLRAQQDTESCQLLCRVCSPMDAAALAILGQGSTLTIVGELGAAALDQEGPDGRGMRCLHSGSPDLAVQAERGRTLKLRMDWCG